MTEEDLTHIATALIARAAREINIRELETQYPDGLDALHIHEAILTAHIQLDWPDPHITTRARTLAVVSSPLLVPLIAIMWTTWRLANLLGGRHGARRSTS